MGLGIRSIACCTSAVLCASWPASSFTPSVQRRRFARTPDRAAMASPAQPPVPSLSPKIEATLDPCVVLMKEMIGSYAAEWEARGGIYSLAQGVVHWQPPPTAKDALRRALERTDDPGDMLHMYGPDEGLPELRERLLEKIRVENRLDHHHVMVTAGANQAYVNCVLTLLGDDHKAVVFRPYYFNHVMALQMVLSDAAEQLRVGPTDGGGVPDLDWLGRELAAAGGAVRMVTITNPCNPTGVRLDRSVVQRAVDLCRQHNAWLVLDCTYEYFGQDPGTFDGCFPDPHVIHIFSFSKAYALAGYRCGYLVMNKDADPLYQQVMKVQDTIPICPSRISQVAALGSLDAGLDWVREKVNTLSVGRQAILKALEPCEQIVGGSGAMYVMCKVSGDDRELARRLVQDYGVAVIPGSFCGAPGWLRVCYSNLAPEQCLEAAKRLELGIKEILINT